MEEIWSAALPLLRERVGERNFSTWIEPIRCSIVGDEICLRVPSRFFQEWVVGHFIAVIRDVVARVSGSTYPIRVVVGGDEERPVLPVAPPEPAPPPVPRRAKIG